MVTSVTNLGRSGLFDWLVQRFSAVILASYTIFLVAILFTHPDMNYQQWRELFDSTFVRIFSLLTLFALCAHAWIGMWTISTDYLSANLLGNRATVLRLLVQAGCALLTAVYLIWGIQILWGI